jgi:flagellar biosynthesis/type III secretory pathway chaperone
MEERVSRLITLLSEKESALQELLQLLEEERISLLHHDMNKLQSQAKRKLELYGQLTSSARLCRQLIDQLATDAGVAGVGSLSPLLPFLPEAERETLQGLQARLLEQGSAMLKRSAFNGHLIQGALLTVTRSLEFFGRILSRSNTYGASGRLVKGASAPRLLRREA